MRAANRGFAAAQCQLGIAYMLGRGVLKDSTKALFWFQKAADQNHAAAYFHIANFYADGMGVPKDQTQADNLIHKAAGLGYAPAQAMMAIKCSHDPKQAAVWMQTAAEQGDSEAQFQLGMYYNKGCGVEMDAEQAKAWFKKAAHQGHEAALNLLAKDQLLGKQIQEIPPLAQQSLLLKSVVQLEELRD